MMERSRRSWRGVIVVAMVAAAVVVSTAAAATGTAAAVPRSLHGTYATPLAHGTISYSAARAIPFGNEGWATVDGTAHRGALSTGRGSGDRLALNWYGSPTTLAGSAMLVLQPDGSWAGTITFFGSDGVTAVDRGTVALRAP